MMLILSVNHGVQDKEIHNIKSLQLYEALEELVGLPSFSFQGWKEMRRGSG